MMFPIENKNITFPKYRLQLIQAAEAFPINTARKPSIQAEVVSRLFEGGHEAWVSGAYDAAFFKLMRGMYVITECNLLKCSSESLGPHLTRDELRKKFGDATSAVEELCNKELKILFEEGMKEFDQAEEVREGLLKNQNSNEGRELDEDEQHAELSEEELMRQEHEKKRQLVLAKQFDRGDAGVVVPGGMHVNTLPGSNVITDQAQFARVFGDTKVTTRIDSAIPAATRLAAMSTTTTTPSSTMSAADLRAAELQELRRKLNCQISPPVAPAPVNTQPTSVPPSNTAVSPPQQRQTKNFSTTTTTTTPGGGGTPVPPPRQPHPTPGAVEVGSSSPSSCFLTFPSAIKAKHFTNLHTEWAFQTTLRGGGLLYPPQRRGLRNLGNTCYMNSVLQCVASIPQLLHYFANSDAWLEDMPAANPKLHSPMTVSTIHKGTRAVETFALVMDNLKVLVANNSQSTAFNPAPLKYTMGEINDNFKEFKQQDANEFFLSLVNALHDGLNKRIAINAAGNNNNNNTPLNTKQRQTSPSFSDEAVKALSHMQQYIRCNSPKSIILKTFMFQTRSVTRCHECLHIASTFGTEFGLEVPISEESGSRRTTNSTTPVALEQCLQSYSELSGFKFNAREIDSKTGKNISGFYCEHCDRRVDATRQTQMFSLPNVLVVTLKRFKSFGNFSEKISTPVSVPNVLDMAPFCCSSTSNSISGVATATAATASSAAISAPYILHRATEAEASSQTGPSPPDNEPSSVVLEPTAGTKYRLIGVVNHRGNCNGGHYTADVRTKGPGGEEVWNSCSDDVVTPATKPSRALAYMLFYALE